MCIQSEHISKCHIYYHDSVNYYKNNIYLKYIPEITKHAKKLDLVFLVEKKNNLRHLQ